MMNGRSLVPAEEIDISNRDWKLLLSVATVITCGKNHVVIDEGSASTSLYKVKKGTLAMHVMKVMKKILGFFWENSNEKLVWKR